jgi:hypothetical protein
VSAIGLAPNGSPRTNKPGLNQQPLKRERGAAGGVRVLWLFIASFEVLL